MRRMETIMHLGQWLTQEVLVVLTIWVGTYGTARGVLAPAQQRRAPDDNRSID